jgi:hypothetical protein
MLLDYYQYYEEGIRIEIGEKTAVGRAVEATNS